MIDTAALGKIAEGLAGKLTNNTYRFVLLLIIVVTAAISLLATRDWTISALFLALFPLLMLFTLLTPNKQPRGWKSVYTFVLMLCFVLVTLVLIGTTVFLSTSSNKDISSDLNSSWNDNFSASAEAFGRKVEKIAVEKGPEYFFVGLNSYLLRCVEDEEPCANMHDHIVSAGTFLSNWESCRQTICRNGTIVGNFDERIYDFWANYRCYVHLLRNKGGYGVDFAQNVQTRYEKLPQVVRTLEVVNRREGIGNSLRVCPEVNVVRYLASGSARTV